MLCFMCYEVIPEGLALKVTLPSSDVVLICEDCLDNLNFPPEQYVEAK